MGCGASTTRPNIRRPSIVEASKKVVQANQATQNFRGAVKGVREAIGQESCRCIEKRVEELGWSGMHEAFMRNDADASGCMNHAEMHAMLIEIFGDELAVKDGQGCSRADSLIKALDANDDGCVSLNELWSSWRSWFGASIKPVRALIIIDVQNDFISGSLSLSGCPAGHNGAEVVPVINQMAAEHSFDAICMSLDWHPHTHCSFFETLQEAQAGEVELPCPVHPTTDRATAMETPLFGTVVYTAPDGETQMPQALWPRHCVADTWGSELHSELTRRDSDVIVRKGTGERASTAAATPP